MAQNKLVCDYCGKERETIMFVIGYSLDKDWVMWLYTGKTSCPDCYTMGREESDLRGGQYKAMLCG